jgi:predicted dinucleotide-binding enzyme
MRVLIIGSGNMGRGIATRALSGGHQVTLYDINPKTSADLAVSLSTRGMPGASVAQTTKLEESARASDVVILASWYGANLRIAREFSAMFEDKLVVDISNPLNATYDALVTAPGSSAAETIQAVLPKSARLVKAFNTTFAGTLLAGQVDGRPLNVFVAGDDASARESIKTFVQSIGLNAVDVGALERSRQLEALGFLGISLQDSLGTGFMSAWHLTMPVAA